MSSKTVSLLDDVEWYRKKFVDARYDKALSIGGEGDFRLFRFADATSYFLRQPCSISTEVKLTHSCDL
jgi:hypothetical protein